MACWSAVNGVTFTPAYGGDALSGQNGSNAAAGALPVGGAISAGYAAILSANDYNTGTGSTPTLTLNGLIVGQHYEVQVWTNDSDGTSLGSQTVRSGGALDPWVVLNMNTTGVSGGRGQYALGTFTADATSQQVKITGSGSAVRINGTSMERQKAVRQKNGFIFLPHIFLPSSWPPSREDFLHDIPLHIRLHGVDQTQLVRVASHHGEQIADPQAALPPLPFAAHIRQALRLLQQQWRTAPITARESRASADPPARPRRARLSPSPRNARAARCSARRPSS